MIFNPADSIRTATMAQSIIDLDEQIYRDFLDEARDIINAVT